MLSLFLSIQTRLGTEGERVGVAVWVRIITINIIIKKRYFPYVPNQEWSRFAKDIEAPLSRWLAVRALVVFASYPDIGLSEGITACRPV